MLLNQGGGHFAQIKVATPTSTIIGSTPEHFNSTPSKPTLGPINAPLALSSTPHPGLIPIFAHTVAAFDHHTANAGIKCAGHLTTRLAPACLKQAATL
jgi:hypothetical protein